MDRERLRKVADLIELEDRFYFGSYTKHTGVLDRSIMRSAARLRTRCGSVGCVAGWAATLALQEDPTISLDVSICTVAMGYLGLDIYEADRLFCGSVGHEWMREHDRDKTWLDMTAVEAAKMLREIADGEVVL